MAIAVQFEFPGESLDKYDRAVAEVPETHSPAGRTVHVCYRTDDGWGVFDVWESDEAFANFGAVLGPVFQKFELQAEPKIRPVHNTM